ncbi:DivIVA domain-containing protein, partial [Mycobacterium kansasii]
MVIVLYALGLLAVAAVLYGVAALVFGRGDETPPLETGATPTVLPAEDVTGVDVRGLRFQQVVR